MQSMILSIRTLCNHVSECRLLHGNLIKHYLLGLFLVLILMPCCLAQTTIFYDDFGDPSLAEWNTFGSPSPVALSSVEGRDGVFDNNGDPNYDSGAISKDALSLQNGFTLETDIFLRITNPSASFACVDFGLTDSTEPNLLEYGLEWYPSGKAYIRGHFSTESGGHEDCVGFYDSSRYINSWHNWKIVVGSDGHVEFYLDDELKARSENRIDPSALEGKRLSISGRSYDGKAYNDYISITANPNNPPYATDDSASTMEDTPVEGNVLTNDSDIDGNLLTATLSAAPANGTATVQPDGFFVYRPNENFNGDDSFEYVVSDGKGGTDSGRVTIMIAPVNDPPVAQDSVASVDEDSSVSIPISSNDPDGDELTITVMQDPQNGDLSENSDGTFAYIPYENYFGPDSFKYIVADGESQSNEATVTITINPVNDAPEAVDDYDYIATEDEALTIGAEIGVLINDSDVDGDLLTASLSVGPNDGIVTIQPDGSFSYQPNENFNGEDSFEYIASDGKGGAGMAIAAITVTPVNDAPVADDDEELTDENLLLTIDVLANDYDPDDEGEVLTITSVANPSHGTASTDGQNVTYMPDLWYSGYDSFAYEVSDSTGLTDTATVDILVNEAIPSASEIDSYIQSLPESVFEKEAEDRMISLSSKFDEVGNWIDSGDYRNAIHHLENIRSKADGSLGGKSNDDWIVDPEAQADLCELIDTLLAALNTIIAGNLPSV